MVTARAPEEARLSAPPPRGLVVAAPASGHGKTTATLAILRALARSGAAVRPFKVGPDYIDPAYLAAAAGAPALNLDPWGMRPGTIAGLVADLGPGTLAVVEGVMGLFDGAADGTGSTAELAETLGLPVVLVVDARGMGASVAALVQGFARHREGLDIAALVLNRVGGARHERMLLGALAGASAPPVLGCLPRDAALELPSRHLGLVQAVEHPDLAAFVERAADLAAAHLDLDRLAALARPVRPGGHATTAAIPPPGQRIALARDAAFAFAYPGLLASWRRAGAEILPFSPLADEPPDPAADAVHLPGGYPELHAERLAGASRCLAGLRAAAARGAGILGECGGYMLLGERLIDRDGRPWPMAGLLPVVTSFAEPRRHLGYREVTLLADTALGPAGARLRAHEFHYASELERRGPPMLEATTADGERLGPQGCAAGRVAGSFLHMIDSR